MRRYWSEWTSEEIAGLDPERTVVVLPVAAVEQHGPHLPLGVDAMINRGILEAALARTPENLAVVVLPAMEVGRSEEHLAYPGSLTVPPAALAGLWTAVAEGVHRSGLRKLLIFNSHGGQSQVMDIVARDLRVRLSMFVVMANWWRLGLPEDLPFSGDELIHGIHAGALETSIMLHLRPDLVKAERCADFRPASLDYATRYRHLGAHGPIPFAWAAQDLHPSGACGDPRSASAAIGRQLVEHAGERLVELFREVSDFPLAALRERQ